MGLEEAVRNGAVVIKWRKNAVVGQFMWGLERCDRGGVGSGKHY